MDKYLIKVTEEQTEYFYYGVKYENEGLKEHLEKASEEHKVGSFNVREYVGEEVFNISESSSVVAILTKHEGRPSLFFAVVIEQPHVSGLGKKEVIERLCRLGSFRNSEVLKLMSPVELESTLDSILILVHFDEEYDEGDIEYLSLVQR